MKESFNVKVARQNGLKTGTEFSVVRNPSVRIVLKSNDLFDLSVDGKVVVSDRTISQVTNMGKRISNPNFSVNTNFVVNRTWVMDNGVRISHFIPDSVNQKVQVSEKNSPTVSGNGTSRNQETLVNEVDNIVETCLTCENEIFLSKIQNSRLENTLLSNPDRYLEILNRMLVCVNCK